MRKMLQGQPLVRGTRRFGAKITRRGRDRRFVRRHVSFVGLPDRISPLFESRRRAMNVSTTSREKASRFAGFSEAGAGSEAEMLRVDLIHCRSSLRNEASLQQPLNRRVLHGPLALLSQVT